MKTQQKKIHFLSQYRDHRLTMEPQEAQYVGPRYVGESKGRAIEFTNGTYATSDPDEIEFLRQRIEAGTKIHEINAPAPEPTALLVELVTCDAERTAEILEEELAGFGRESVIAAAREKLTLLTEQGD